MRLPCGIINKSYSQDTAIVRTNLQWLLLVLALITLFTFPYWASPHWISVMIGVWISIIGVMGLTLLTGYAGQLSLGHMAFVAIGAYTVAILMSDLNWPFWAALPCAGMISGCIGVIFGLPSLRIKGFYLVIATLAAQFIIVHIISRWDSLTGGVFGLSVPKVTLGGFEFKSDFSYYFLAMIFALIAILIAKNLSRSRIGRSWIAIRDNDIAAEIMGVDPFKYKLLAFFFGCFFAGIAGGLWAPYLRYLTPEQFTLMGSVWYLGYMVIGGMGSIMGPIAGVIFITILDEFTAEMVTDLATGSPVFAGFVQASRYIVFGLAIILFLIFEPRGIAHRWERIKNSYRLWPFSY
ncbi:MAG: branched-chain amino acid ABC transporter permease [Chloroflexi bacterium]|nr:branched-chain amino acid ABC transporter permease [Chloroflexota bacterium]